MKRHLSATFIAATLLLGTASLANAVSSAPAQSFAERFASLQAISSNSSQFQRPDPAAAVTTTGTAHRPAFAETFAQMQAIASNSGAFMTDSQNGDSARASVTASAQAESARLARWWAARLHPAGATRSM